MNKMKKVLVTKLLKECSPLYISDLPTTDKVGKKYASNIKIYEIDLEDSDEIIKDRDNMSFKKTYGDADSILCYVDEKKDFCLMGAYIQKGIPRIYISCTKPKLIKYLILEMDIEE